MTDHSYLLYILTFYFLCVGQFGHCRQGKNMPSEMITELKSRKMYHVQSSYARVSTYTSRRLNAHKDEK